MLSVKGADGSIVVMANSSNVFGAVQEVDGDTRGEGEDPRGADGDCCVQLRAEGNAFHWVHNSLQKINYESKKFAWASIGVGGGRGEGKLVFHHGLKHLVLGSFKSFGYLFKGFKSCFRYCDKLFVK